MEIPRALLDFLEANSVKHEVLNHSEAYTAQEMAHAVHIPGRDVAKGVLVRDGDKHQLVVMSADYVIDLERLGTALGLANPCLATEAELESHFPDCEIGAVPIFGNLYGLTVAIDSQLVPEPTIAFPAGNHEQTIRMDTSDFMRLAKPTIVDVGVHV